MPPEGCTAAPDSGTRTAERHHNRAAALFVGPPRRSWSPSPTHDDGFRQDSGGIRRGGCGNHVSVARSRGDPMLARGGSRRCVRTRGGADCGAAHVHVCPALLRLARAGRFVFLLVWVLHGAPTATQGLAGPRQAREQGEAAAGRKGDPDQSYRGQAVLGRTARHGDLPGYPSGDPGCVQTASDKSRALKLADRARPRPALPRSAGLMVSLSIKGNAVNDCDLVTDLADTGEEASRWQ